MVSDSWEMSGNIDFRFAIASSKVIVVDMLILEIICCSINFFAYYALRTDTLLYLTSHTALLIIRQLR